MTKTQNYFKIEPDGSIKYVSETERDIDLDQSILNRFAADSPLRSNCLMSASVLPEVAGLGSIGICMRRASVAFTVRMASLPMRTHFTLKKGFMVPQFRMDGETEYCMNWTVPETMRLYFLANFKLPMQADVQFLVAVDAAGRFYRLPLSNLYEDSRICHGEYECTGSTLIDTLSKAWVQFHRSRWQSHLLEKAKDIVINSEKLFRFKPKETDGFDPEPLESGVTWESLSQRVSTAFIEENLVL